MAIVFGQTEWQGLASGNVKFFAEGCVLPNNGGTIICKNGGIAWIVAPPCTEVCQTWNNSTSTLVGNKCCVCDWPTLNTAIINAGLTPGDWFVPTFAQLQNPGYCCICKWPDAFGNFDYWSSTEVSATNACEIRFTIGVANGGGNKATSYRVRAFRCVTY